MPWILNLIVRIQVNRVTLIVYVGDIGVLRDIIDISGNDKVAEIRGDI